MLENEPTQEYFTSNQNEIAYNVGYLDWGNIASDRVLLCVHGLSRNARDFDYVANRLCKDYRVIAIDIVGRGSSDWITDRAELYNFGTYINDVVQLINHLGIKSQIDWLGTSMGGIIGMMIAEKFPSMIRHLVLNDVGSFIPKEPLVKIAKYVNVEPEFNNLEEAEAALRISMANFGIKSDINWQYITRNSVKQLDSGKYSYSYDVALTQVFSNNNGVIEDIDLSSIWQNANFSTCHILRGETSDILPINVLDDMVKSRANVTAHEFTNVGHAPALMESEQLDYVVNYFKRIK